MASVLYKYNIVLVGIGSLLTGCAITHAVSTGGAAVSSTVGENYATAKTVASNTAFVVEGGVQEAADHAENFGSAAKENLYNTTDHMATWMRAKPIKPPLPVASSYCYRSFQDIMCYRAPMPGWEHRLVAYQGTDAPPPAPAMMASLPLHEPDPAMLPANRAQRAKPIFTTPPADPKDADKPDAAAAAASAVTAIPDAAHEQLLDPTMAPQL